MDALKKFLTKKKTDKVFKAAGPGHTLTEGQSSSSKQGSHSQGQGHHGHNSRSIPAKPSEEKRAAAAAALARIEKNKKPDVNSKDMLASRQLAYIKEQARKELEAEKNEEDANSKGNQDYQEEQKFETDSIPRVIDPSEYAVSGVYFTCPLIGPEILTKEEIVANIREFLLEQPEEELGVTSCLLIYSCNRPLEKITTCVETLCKYLDNIITNPDESKFKRIRCSNRAFQEKVAYVEGALQFLRAAGFGIQMMKADPSSEAEEEFWVFTATDKDNFVPQLIELRDTLKQTTPILPEIDRNVQVLMPTQVHQMKELPNEFYTLSIDEIKKEQKIKAELAEREQTLRTQAMRDRDELREQRLYRYGVMRVRFPDGLTLQGTFKAYEKISDLYDFVRENLVAEDIEFELIKPGGENLSEMKASLAESRLTPASILNFKVTKAPTELKSGEISFLKQEILALVRSAD